MTSYIGAREKTVDLLDRDRAGPARLLTSAQYRILPTQLAGYMDKRTLQGSAPARRAPAAA